MARHLLFAAAAALVLAACGQQGSGPPLPKTEAGAANAPTQMSAAPAQGHASLSAEQRQQLEQLVRGYIDSAVGNYGDGMGAAAGFSDEITSLQPGSDHRWQVNLAGGAAYRIIGACDNECSNLDIELIDSHGGVVASDTLPDDVPVVNFTPAANGTFIVRIMMQSCTVAPCYAGARMLSGATGK